MKQTIRLEEVTLENSAQMASLLSNDRLLAKANGSSDLTPIKPKEFFNKTNQWQIANNAKSYVISLGDSSIGLISLSNITKTSASVGYWITSDEWHKGYGTQAFKLLLAIAKKRGMKSITSTINLDNVASLRIWEKAGAEINKTGDKARAQLFIS